MGLILAALSIAPKKERRIHHGDGMNKSASSEAVCSEELNLGQTGCRLCSCSEAV